MSQYSFIIDNMTWSFSRLQSFCNCKYEWYLQYIEELKGETNFYAVFGKVCHEILEKYARGELNLFSLVDSFNERYDEETSEFDYYGFEEMKEKYRNKAIEYFENIDLDLERYEVLGIEQKCEFEIDGKNFIGYIDLLLRDKETSKIIVLDHKSSEYPYGKQGKILKSQQKKFDQYKKQLYLYSIWVLNNYGEYPAKIGWNYFKARKWDFIDFCQNEYEGTKEWVVSMVNKIESEEDFLPKNDFFYCRNLCSFRNECEYNNWVD